MNVLSDFTLDYQLTLFSCTRNAYHISLSTKRFKGEKVWSLILAAAALTMIFQA